MTKNIMNRIELKFKQLRKSRGKAFIAFITAGDPNLAATVALVLGLEKAGVDIVELGVPFSDPLADGHTIQAACERALKKGVSLEKILSCVSQIRRKSQIPIALMTYYNPVLRYREEHFFRDAKRHGVDGVIIPDLPPEEAKNLIRAAKSERISTIFFISPTTTKDRVKHIVKVSSGFIYYVSLTGVTGARKSLPESIARHVKSVKRSTNLPVCVGFGISTPVQVKAMAEIADGVIVGSAIVEQIQKNTGKKDLVERVKQFVQRLTHVS